MIINRTGFGYIVIDGRRYDHDVVICIDRVVDRPKHLSREYSGLYGHTPLSRRELEYIVGECSGFDTIVIGTGQYGYLPVMDDAKNYLKTLNVEVVYEKTPNTIEIINRLVRNKKKILAILHVTC